MRERAIAGSAAMESRSPRLKRNGKSASSLRAQPPYNHVSAERSIVMPEVTPKMSRAKLQRSARQTARGKGRRTALPGVKTDAKHVKASDKSGYQANRDLAELIGAAVRAKKKRDTQGAHLILG